MIHKKTNILEFAGIGLIVLIIVLFNAGYIIRGIRGRALGKPAQIVIDTKIFANEVIDTSFYHALSQGGEEKKDMILPVLDKVSVLKPKYIRLDHIYDGYDVVTRTGGVLTYSFSGLDQAVETILKSGATPVLCLSYMPPAISKDGSVTSLPSDWNDWSAVVQKTVEWYSGKNGKNIKNMIYEVWNEPDLPQFGEWKTYGDKNYLDLYRFAVLGATRAGNTNPFEIGGPSTTGLYKGWIDGILSQNTRIDFLSWHTYDFDPLKFREEQESLNKWLDSYPKHQNLKRLITEFGFVGSKDARYGTQFGAAYQAAVIRQLVDYKNINLFTFQIKDGPSDDDGKGWGLLTHESKEAYAKPRYRVFSFLDKIVGLKLRLTGEGTWVTGYAAKDGDTIRAVFINYDPESRHEESFPVRFINLESGNYNLRQQYFGGQDITAKEVVTGDSLQKTFFIRSNAILLIELHKI